jgi:hypothetical protein
VTVLPRLFSEEPFIIYRHGTGICKGHANLEKVGQIFYELETWGSCNFFLPASSLLHFKQVSTN